jgi:DNA-directed RNA polymerase II subunit RPB1
MNISLSQGPDAISEIKELMSTNETFISSQDSKPMLSLKEDMMTGWYKLTQGLVVLKKELWFDTVIRLGIDYVTKKIAHIRKVYSRSSLFQTEKQKRKENGNEDLDLDQQVLDSLVYSGFGLFSMLCPDDFEFTILVDPIKNPTKRSIYITQGTMIGGTFDSEALGSSSGSLMHHIAKDYGNRFASEFVVNLQCFASDTFQHLGFSVGMKDFIPKQQTEVKKQIENIFFKVMSDMENQKDPYLLEALVSTALGKPKDLAREFAKSLDTNNNLVAMVDCGSKGSWSNIAQITSIVGQQFVSDKRISKVFGGRTLSCYPRYSFRSDTPDQLPINYTYKDVDRILESRGFIKSSYFHGLTPVEYFLICPGGREGLINTAITTAETGYVQRKIAKILEDLQISYAGTVVTPSQNIIQFAYGGDNLDAARLIKYDKGQRLYSFVDISHVADKVNRQVEINQQI